MRYLCHAVAAVAARRRIRNNNNSSSGATAHVHVDAAAGWGGGGHPYTRLKNSVLGDENRLGGGEDGFKERGEKVYRHNC